MMFGLGAATTATTTTPAPTTSPFVQGLEAWETPATALSAIAACLSRPSACFTSANAPALAGLFLPPLALVAVAVMMMKGGRGR